MGAVCLASQFLASGLVKGHWPDLGEGHPGHSGLTTLLLSPSRQERPHGAGILGEATVVPSLPTPPQ